MATASPMARTPFAGSIAFKTTTSRSETTTHYAGDPCLSIPGGLSKRSSGAAAAQLHFGSRLRYGAAGCTPAGGRDGAVTTYRIEAITSWQKQLNLQVNLSGA